MALCVYVCMYIFTHTHKLNRMGKTRDLFKKIRDTKGTFHAKMGSIKDRNCMKDKAQGKCLICRQAGHWAKDCPKHNKSSRTACH